MKKALSALLMLAMVFSCLLTVVSCDDSCQHEWTEVKSEAALRTAGTPTSKATYWKTCSICGEISTEYYFEGNYMPNAPTFSVDGGSYDAPQSLTLSATQGTIHYTTDGSTPTSSSPVYSSPIAINSAKVVKAIVIVDSAEYDPSAVASKSYSFNYEVYNITTSTAYPAFADAIAAAASNDSLVLGKNITLDSTVQVKVGLVLDLDGCTIECTSVGCAIKVAAASGVLEGTVTIKNGTLKGKPTGDGTSSLFVCVAVDTVNVTDMTVTSNVDAGQTAAATALYFNGVRTATVNNCTVVGKVIGYQRKKNDLSIHLTINGGTFSPDPNAPDDKLLRNKGDADSITGSIIVNGATFNGSIDEQGYAPITINSGTWSTDVSSYVPATSTIVQNGNVWNITVNQ